MRLSRRSSSATSLGVGEGYLPDPLHASGRDLMTQVLAVEDFPANVPLYFLRDLFVCILLSPILAWLISRAPILTLTALLVIALVPELSIYIVLKRSILFSFSLGIFIALQQFDLRALDRFAVDWRLSAARRLGTSGDGDLFHRPFPAGLGAILPQRAGNRRCTGLLAALGSADQDADSANGSRRPGASSFWIFCAHHPLSFFSGSCGARRT